MRKRRRVRGIRDNTEGSRESTTAPRILQRQLRCWWRKMNTNTTTTPTEASVEDIWRVQGIGEEDGVGSGSTMGPVDWKQQQSVDFPSYRVANSNTVLSLSCRCLVLILFSLYSFFPRSLQEIISALKSCRKYFCTKCTLTLRMYPLHKGELKNYEFS